VLQDHACLTLFSRRAHDDQAGAHGDGRVSRRYLVVHLNHGAAVAADGCAEVATAAPFDMVQGPNLGPLAHDEEAAATKKLDETVVATGRIAAVGITGIGHFGADSAVKHARAKDAHEARRAWPAGRELLMPLAVVVHCGRETRPSP